MKNSTINKRDAYHKPSIYHHLSTAVFLFYISEQVFLPYSHSLTKVSNRSISIAVVLRWAICHFTARQQSCGKGMFSQASVILFTRKRVVRDSSHACPPPATHGIPLRHTRPPPPPVRLASWRHASYWNSVLLVAR